MGFSANGKCDSGQYYELSTHLCHHCNDVCDRRYETPERCRTFCPEVWKTQRNAVGISSTAAATTTTTLAALSTATIKIGELIWMQEVLIILIFILLIIIIVTITVPHWKILSQKSAQQLVTDITLDGSPDETKGLYLSVSGAVISQPTNGDFRGFDSEDQDKSSRKPPDQDHRDSTFRTRWVDSDATEKNRGSRLSTLTETLPKSSPDRRDGYGSRTDEDQTAGSDIILGDGFPQSNESVEMRNDEDMASFPLLSLHTASEGGTSTIFDLRSDPENVDNIEGNRRSVFNEVLDAYVAVNTRTHQYPYIRGCAICNDKMQVMITDKYSLQRAENEIRNIIPSNVLSDVVEVKRLN